MSIDRRVDPSIVNDGRRFGRACGEPYRLLEHLAPGLCVDVGAAIGRTVGRVLDANPQSRVIAYEPFPGNHPYFTQELGGDARVRLRPVAVADRAGREPFAVPDIVASGSSGWAKRLVGYSSVGHLARTAPLSVDVVTLDDEIGEHVRLLKIDVQGGEDRVLAGARRLIAGPGVDMILIEFNGTPATLRTLRTLGYVIFDSPYMIWPTRRYYRNWLRLRPDRFVPGWDVVERGERSLGGGVEHVWPRVPVRSFNAYCVWFFANRVARTGMQTDLLCVQERFLPVLFDAMDQR
jgi:FkbM family methyltransferase